TFTSHFTAIAVKRLGKVKPTIGAFVSVAGRQITLFFTGMDTVTLLKTEAWNPDQPLLADAVTDDEGRVTRRGELGEHLLSGTGVRRKDEQPQPSRLVEQPPLPVRGTPEAGEENPRQRRQ